jgi:hypothetical protein
MSLAALLFRAVRCWLRRGAKCGHLSFEKSIAERGGSCLRSTTRGVRKVNRFVGFRSARAGGIYLLTRKTHGLEAGFMRPTAARLRRDTCSL